MSAITMPFGKYRGLSLREIAESRDGLLYLDWIQDQEWVKPSLRKEIVKFCREKANEIDSLVEDGED